MNEMGAAWIADNHTIPLILPPMVFSEVGCLNEVNECVMLDDKGRLVKICEELNERFNLKNTPTRIVNSIEDFINSHVNVK